MKIPGTKWTEKVDQHWGRQKMLVNMVNISGVRRRLQGMIRRFGRS
jgi:hypothetical protein